MMAEGRNNGKPKRPHSYRPYDSANSSIVSRITNRVSGILPQPSSWLGKWLSPAEQQHFRSESEDDDLARQQPPLKRFCLHPSTDGPTHQNHVRRTVAREPELSPILRDRSDQPDGVIAGPSGLHLRGANFVASTPAVSAAEPKANGPVRVNGELGISLLATPNRPDMTARGATDHPTAVSGDEGSDGSESTSGCSSLVPQGERSSNAPFPEITPKASPETPKLSHTPDSLGGRTLTLKPKNRTMDLSYSFSKNRPSFDAYAFNNPLNKSSSFNSSFNRTMDDSTASPFYRGRTMYGGSSSCKESLSLSLMSPKVGTPRIVSVKPTVTPRQNRDISTSALKILRALEQFSTPVLEAKKIPVVNDSERRKRKAVQPFEDLVIPTVPDLLRIKRKKVTSESGGISAASSAASTPKPYQLPPPVQPLSVRDDVAEPKRVVKGKDELSTETAEKVDLPTVPLPITTLPSFNLSSLPRSCSTYTLTNSTSASAAPLPSKISSVPSPTISSFKFTAAPGATATASVGKLKFSEPSFEASVPAQITSIKPALQFREPLDAAKSESPKPTTTLAQSPKKPSPELNFIANSSTFQPKLKTASTSKAVKSEIDNSSSIADFFKKDNISSKNDKSESGEQVSKSLSEQFKPKTGSWTCEACLVPNPSDSTKCCCCETPKKGPDQPKQAPQPPEQTWSCNKCSFKNKQSADVCVCGLKKGEKSTIAPLSAKPSADTWECNVCLVRNKCSETACVACNSPKPGVAPSAKPAAPSLLTAFKKPEGSWECSVCMVNNKAADNACVACTSPKPGAEKEKPKQSFSFGIPPAAAPAPAAVPGGFSFGATSVKSDAPSGFTFGIPKTEKNEEEKKTEVSNLFSFGSAATTQKKDPTPDVVTLDTPDDKKDRPPKKSVSFGEPLVAEKSTTEPPKTSAPTTATFSFEAAKTESSTFPPPTRSIFGATSVVASSSTDAKTTAELPFKLGNSGSSGVSSSTDSATSSVIPTTTASSGFNVFGSGTKSTSIFPTASTNNLFPSSSAEPKASTFSFGAVKSDAPKVDASSTNLFSGQKDQKTGLFGMPAPSEAKASGFFNSTEAKPVFGAENKPVFGSAGNKPTFGAVESKIVFGGSAPENTPAFGAETKPAFGGDSNNVFGGVKANFVSTSNSLFEMKPATTVSNAGFNAAPTVFGSATPINNAEKPLFGSLPSGPSSTPFVFKASEPKVGGFSFTPSAPSVAPTNAFGFNAEPPKFGNAEPPKFGNAVGGLTAPQSSNVFGTPAAATPLFNNPTPAPTPSLFTFGAPQPEQQQPQQPAPLFGFSAPQQQAVTTPFGFNVNNTPAQPPTFDPNQKPTFNFTGGSTPNFAAPPSTSTEPKPDRKIRRAVRRTQPR